MIKNNLATWRSKARKGRGINKADLARRIGVDRSYITRLEKGQVKPNSEVMFRVAEYFDCPIEDIFKYTPE